MITDACIGAVVLAGGRVPDALAGLCAHRALLRLRGRLLLDYILRAVSDVPCVTATVTLAPAETLDALAALPGVKAASSDTLVDNMLRGVALLAPSGVSHVLFITGDIPLITPAGLTEFIDDSLASGAALTYPIISRAESERRFPGARRTYARLKEGIFTGGNAVFAEAHLLDSKRDLIQGLYAARKEPLKLAQLLGWGTVGRLLLGSLDIPYLEAVATRILSAPVRAIVCPHPEIGFDVDKPEDLEAVERALAVADTRVAG